MYILKHHHISPLKVQHNCKKMHVKGQIQHKAKLSTVFVSDTLFFRQTTVSGTLINICISSFWLDIRFLIVLTIELVNYL